MRFLSAERKRKLRRLLERRVRTIGPEEAGAMRFYQYKPSTAEFFYRYFGYTDIAIRDTPHFRLADALARKSKVAEAQSFYMAYLAASWGRERAHEFPARLKAFQAHFNAFLANKKMPRPVLAHFGDSTHAFAVDGNHRLSFSSALDRPIQCEVLPADLAILIYSQVKDFFDTKYLSLPRESIYLNGTMIAASRQNDALERLDLVPVNIIRGKTVLDVGCNIGMNSFFARSTGAVSCLGLDSSPGLIELATRFSIFQGLYPSVSFKQHRVGDKGSLPTSVYDTAFMRVQRDDATELDEFLNIVRNNVKSVIVLEDEIGALNEKRSGFFQNGLVKNVRELGKLDERGGSKLKRSNTSSLWLMERA
jgi:hypothetical protein